MHLCANCFTSTSSLTEHRSETDPPCVFHAECCPGGCDLPEEHTDDVAHIGGRRFGKSRVAP